MSETKGSWKTATAGGCFNKPSWRLNQQYSLRIDSTATDFKLELSQTTSYNIGVYLLKDTADSVVPIYHDAQEKLIHKSGFKSKAVVTIEVPKLEKGVYHVIPCTFEPGKEGKFVLKTSHGKLKRISMWHVTTWQGAWKGASAGGCKNHKSFKENPQFLFKLEGEEAALATAVVSQDEHEEFNNLGFYVFKTEPDSPMKVVHAKDIVTSAPFEDDCETSHEFSEGLPPGDFSLIPCTFEPGQESRFTVHLFTSIAIYDHQNPPPKPDAPTEAVAPLQTGPTAQEMSAKWADEIKAHQETLKTVSALQEQLRVAKDSNRTLNEEIEALRRGGGNATSGASGKNDAKSEPGAPRTATTEPQSGTQVSIFGSWKGETAGGCMNHTTWRANPQLFLNVPSEGTKTTFTFVQEPNADGKLSQIGFYILHGSVSHGRRVVWLDHGDEDILTKPKFTSSKQLKIEMTLPATPSKEPYIIIPCTYNPGAEHEWTLTMTTDSPVTLSPVPPAGHWKIATVNGAWTEETAGGCRNHSTFTSNPQYLLTVPQGTVEPQARILLFQREKEEFDSISAYIVKIPDSAPAKLTKLTKVEAGDVILKPSFNNPEETCIAMPANLTAGRFVVIPCTFSPKNLASFEMQVVSSHTLKFEALGDGTDLSVTGEWKGKTAGGCLNDPIPFKHNTQFHLSLQKEHTLIFKQSQQPENALVAQGFYIFKSRSAKRKFKIKKDDQIAKSGFIKAKDLIGEHTLPAGNYIVVPCTFSRGEEASFKLSVLSKDNDPNFLEFCHLQTLPDQLQEFSGDAEWTSETAGGCLNHMTWVFNPQFQFSTEKKCDVTVFLSVPTLDSEEKIKDFSGIGFYIVPSDSNSPVRLEMAPKDVIKKASFRRSNEVAVQVTLEAGSYNIIPATLKAGYCAPFTVTLFTDNLTSAEFRNLSGAVRTFKGEWKEGNAGGNTSDMEKWLTNTRYYIAAKKYAKMTVLLLQRPELSAAKGDRVEDSSWKAVGFVVTNGDVDGNPKTSQATDLIAAAPFEAERDVVATFELEPTLEPFIVIPSTFEPGQFGTYSLTFVMDPAVVDSVALTTTPPNISEAELQEQLQAEVLLAKLQKCVNTTGSSSVELGRLIKLAGLSALDSPAAQLTAIVKKLQALLNALKAPELYAKEIEEEAAKVAEASASVLPGPPPPPPPSGAPKPPSVPSTSTGAQGSVEAGEVYDGASKGLKPVGERAAAPKSYASPQEEMLAMIAQGRAQLKNAADRKLKDKPVDKDSLLCAFANSFDMIASRRRAVEDEDEDDEDDDDDWD